MSSYHITDVERLTGIRAHTIRIWEKRYGIVDPHRTNTNIRYYDDAQLRKLLNVSTLLQQGQKISAVSKLTDKELAEMIRGLDVNTGVPEDVISQTFMNNLVTFMIGFDEDGFEKTFSAAVNRFGVYQAMHKVFYPFLHKTGTLWSLNEIMPAQEHFAMNIIKRKLLAAIDGLPPVYKSDKRFVLYLPQDEWHEISLLFSDYIIRSKGYRTLYLGQSVPYENIEQTILQYKPTHLLGFYIAEKNIGRIETEVNHVAQKHPKLSVLISGSSIIDNKGRFLKNVVCLAEPDSLNKLLA